MSNATNQIIAQHQAIEEFAQKGREHIARLKNFIQSNLKDVLQLGDETQHSLQYKYFGLIFIFRIEISYNIQSAGGNIVGYCMASGVELKSAQWVLSYLFDTTGNVFRIIGDKHQSIPAIEFPDYFIAGFFAKLTANGANLVLYP